MSNTEYSNPATYELMRDYIVRVKEKFGLDIAKLLIKTSGKVEKMGDIEEANAPAVVEMAKRVLDTTEEDDALRVLEEADQPEPVDELDVPATEANTFYACSAAMIDDAVAGLNKMPEGADVEQAINAIYNAWVQAGHVKHYD